MIKLVLALLLSFKIVFAGSACYEAGLDINKFMEASVGQILTISKMKIAPETQNQKLEELIAGCVSVDKVSKRVIGRAKWQELNPGERANFLKEYPVYFVKVFRAVTLSALSGVQSYTFTNGGRDDTYDINFISANKNANPIQLTLRIEQNNGHLEITDGEAFNISVVNSQKQMFDRLYDQNPNIIKNFNATKFISQINNQKQ